MKSLPIYLQIAYADLIGKAFDAEFDDAFPENGRFSQRMRRGRAYWYYLGYARNPDGSTGQEVQRYVGPASDPTITRRVEQFQEIKSNYRARRQIASHLRAAGLPRPAPLEGSVAAALARSGLFPMRGVLIGSLAFQTYSGLLGVLLKDALSDTEGVAIACDYGVSIWIGEDGVMEEMGDLLRRVEPSFQPVPSLARNPPSAGFQTDCGFRVQFLTANRDLRGIEGDASDLPAVGGAGVSLGLLDYLTRLPCRSVLLHEAGVPVMVPAPERYAMHKLMISAGCQHHGRDSQIDARRDLAQASGIIAAMHHLRMSQDLGFAWIEAQEHGDTWRGLLAEGAQMLGAAERTALRNGIQTAAGLEKIKDWKALLSWNAKDL